MRHLELGIVGHAKPPTCKAEASIESSTEAHRDGAAYGIGIRGTLHPWQVSVRPAPLDGAEVARDPHICEVSTYF